MPRLDLEQTVVAGEGLVVPALPRQQQGAPEQGVGIARLVLENRVVQRSSPLVIPGVERDVRLREPVGLHRTESEQRRNQRDRGENRARFHSSRSPRFAGAESASIISRSRPAPAFSSKR